MWPVEWTSEDSNSFHQEGRSEPYESMDRRLRRAYDSDVYAYEECDPVSHDASHLQEHFEALVPYG